tara:strand:+ start:562 stop:768 length:207 start_codon:yes stop_codon:yes gene_type:complete
MKTEAQALECWCPVSGITSIEWSSDKELKISSNAKCVGQECMWWQWQYGGDEPKEPGGIGEKGYCGAI